MKLKNILRDYQEHAHNFQPHILPAPSLPAIKGVGMNFVPLLQFNQPGAQSLSIKAGLYFDGENPFYDVIEKQLKIEPNSALAKTTLDSLKRFMGNINGSNVLRVIGFDPRAPHPRTYTQWCAGGHLGRQADVRFTLPERVHILTTALNGLKSLHNDFGYLHYDIKPENIFVDFQKGMCVGIIGDITRSAARTIVRVNPGRRPALTTQL
jgi:hypothetical protein